MFDLAWSELAVIGLVSVLVLGPKELPQAMRTMAKLLRKMRSLTSDLQGHMNEIVREAELEDVRKSIQQFSTTNLKAEIEKVVDPSGELGAQMNAPMIPESGEAVPEPAALPVAESATAEGAQTSASGPAQQQAPTPESPGVSPPESSTTAAP